MHKYIIMGVQGCGKGTQAKLLTKDFDIVIRRLAEHDWNYGFVLDGFPRNRPQAEFFLESYDVDAVIHIEVPDETVLSR